MKKLDPELRHAARALDNPAGPELDPATRVSLVLEFTGDIADLEAVEFAKRTVVAHPTQGYKIATGTIPVGRLAELAAIDQVVLVETEGSFQPTLDYSLPAIRADVLRTGNPSRQGQGVVIGIIDTGIDWRHKAFCTAQGETETSRILSIWDQRPRQDDPPGGTTVPGRVGRFYTQAQLNEGLAGTREIPMLDRFVTGKTSGHGTHVAGVAAGSGRGASCCCNGGDKFIGVAPKADLIVVVLAGLQPGAPAATPLQNLALGERAGLVDALDHIFGFNHGPGVRKPTVVNISLGDNLGPHDGTTTVERAIDAIVAAGSGRAVVVGAGNSGRIAQDERQEQKTTGEMNSHAQGSVPQGTTELEFVFPDFRNPEPGSLQRDPLLEEYVRLAILDLWYDRAGTLAVAVIDPSGAVKASANHGADFLLVNNPAAEVTKFVIDGTANGVHGRDNNFRILMRRMDRGQIETGRWKLRLTNPNPAPVNFHCWIGRNTRGPRFLRPVTPADGKIRASNATTLTAPAAAQGAISVANYSAKSSCCDSDPTNVVADDSGRGPALRLGVGARSKPDIAAPGNGIMSAIAEPGNLVGDCCDCCSDWCCTLYDEKSGTSISAPHVTGAVALMLEKNPGLLWNDIRDILRNTAIAPPQGEPATAWGAGKLNVEAAVIAVPAPGPPPPPPPGPAPGGGGGGGNPNIRLETVGTATEPIPPAFAGDSLIPAPLRIVRARLHAVPNGQHLAAAVSRHFSEVRRLVNTNRRVATLWHRSEGPRMLRELVNGALDETAPGPIVTAAQRRYIERWCDILMRYGSPRLRAGIERHRSALIALLETPLAAQACAHAAVGP